MSPEDFAAELAEHTFDKEAVGGAPGMDYSGHTYHGRQRLETAAAPRPQPKVDGISGATRNVTPRPAPQPKPAQPITRWYEPRLGRPENAPTHETRLDQLATEGVRFNGGFNFSPSGTPSRASMIAGYRQPMSMPSRAAMIAQKPLRPIEYQPMPTSVMTPEQLQAHKKWQMDTQVELEQAKMEQRRKSLSSRASRLFDAGYRYDPESNNWVNAEGDTHPAGDVRPYSAQQRQGELTGESTPQLEAQKSLIQRDWTGAPYMAGMVTPSGVIPADPSGMTAPGFGDNVNQNVAALVALGKIKTPSEAAKYRSAFESGVEFTPETFAQRMEEYKMPPTPPPAAPAPTPKPAGPPAATPGAPPAGPPPGAKLPAPTPPGAGPAQGPPPVLPPNPPPRVVGNDVPEMPAPRDPLGKSPYKPFDATKYLPDFLQPQPKPRPPEGWHPPMAVPEEPAPTPDTAPAPAPTGETPPGTPATTEDPTTPPEKSFGGFSEALGSLFGGKGLGDAWGQLTGGGKMGVGVGGGLLLLLLLSKLFGKRGSIEDYTDGEIKRANDLMDQMMGKAAFTSPGVKPAPRFSRRGRGTAPEKKFTPGHNFQGSTAKRIQPMNNVRETGADKAIDRTLMGKSSAFRALIKQSAGPYGQQGLGHYTRSPVAERGELSDQDKATIAEGESRWWPKIFQSMGDTPDKMMASPMKNALLMALLAGGGGALAGSMVGYGGPHLPGAAVGGALGAGIGGLGTYFGRKAKNDDVKDMLMRHGDNISRRDILADPLSGGMPNANPWQGGGGGVSNPLLSGLLAANMMKYNSAGSAFGELTKSAFLAWGGGSAGLHPKGKGIGGEIGYTNLLGVLPIPLAGVDIGGPKKGFGMGITPDPGSEIGISPYIGMRWNHPRRTGLSRQFPRGLPEIIYDKLKGRTKEDAIRKSYPELYADESSEVVDEVPDDESGELAEVDDDSEVEAAKEAAYKLAMKPMMAVRIRQTMIATPKKKTKTPAPALAPVAKKTRTPSVRDEDTQTASTTDMAKSKDRKGQFAVT